MTRDQKFLAGLAAGVAAAFVGSRLARGSHAIDFGGSIVLITGGSRGLGLVMARKLASQGARLVLIARDQRELDRAKRMLEEEYGAQVLAVRCDVRRQADVRRPWLISSIGWATSTC